MWTLECEGPYLESRHFRISPFLDERMELITSLQTRGYGSVQAKAISLGEPFRPRGDSVSKIAFWLEADCVLNVMVAGFKIDEKSVSRQHMTIQVSKVTSGDGVSEFLVPMFPDAD